MSEYESVNGDTNLLHEEKRLLLVIYRIRQSNADIITLQEVEKSQYDTILSELSDEYESLGLTSHKLSYWTSEWLAEGETPKENGQATFVRKNMFKVIEKKTIQTTDDGNRVQIAVLQTIDSISNGLTSNLILVNLHLESGMVDWKHETRKQQVTKIHGEVEKLINIYSLNPIPILVGDFNTFGDQLGMQQVRHLHYVDVAEILGQETPTYIVVVDESYKVTLDHLVLRECDVQDGRVAVKVFQVPDLSSHEYSQDNHKSIIIEAMCDRLQRKGLSLADGLKCSDEALQILLHIPPSPPNFTESYALKALRVGSDHLPLYVELELQSI